MWYKYTRRIFYGEMGEGGIHIAKRTNMEKNTQVGQK